jgi:hypothetical protein
MLPPARPLQERSGRTPPTRQRKSSPHRDAHASLTVGGAPPGPRGAVAAAVRRHAVPDHAGEPQWTPHAHTARGGRTRAARQGAEVALAAARISGPAALGAGGAAIADQPLRTLRVPVALAGRHAVAGAAAVALAREPAPRAVVEAPRARLEAWRALALGAPLPTEDALAVVRAARRAARQARVLEAEHALHALRQPGAAAVVRAADTGSEVAAPLPAAPLLQGPRTVGPQRPRILCREDLEGLGTSHLKAERDEEHEEIPGQGHP